LTALVWTAAVLLIVTGLVGIVVPALPGTVLVFAGLWLAAWADGFMRVGTGTLVVLGVLTAASYTVDFAAGAMGVRRLGASPRAMLGATLGTLVGLFFGLPGLIIGPFVGAMIAELTVQRNLARAGRAGVAAWIGIVVGTMIKVGLVFVMLGIFLAAFFLF
jgi:uncharacterized protein YqgC (DUF456 family)